MAWLLADGAPGIKLRIRAPEAAAAKKRGIHRAADPGEHCRGDPKMLRSRTTTRNCQKAEDAPMQGKTVFLCAMLIASAAHADAFSESRGVWMRNDGNAKVSIAPCGKQLCATNLWIRDTSKGEQVGDRLVMTLRPSAKESLTGKAYDAKRNLTYSMTLRVTKSGLTTRGCVAAGLICKDVSWTPAK